MFFFGVFPSTNFNFKTTKLTNCQCQYNMTSCILRSPAWFRLFLVLAWNLISELAQISFVVTSMCVLSSFFRTFGGLLLKSDIIAGAFQTLLTSQGFDTVCPFANLFFTFNSFHIHVIVINTVGLQGVPAYYDFWDLEKIELCEISTSEYYIANFH